MRTLTARAVLKRSKCLVPLPAILGADTFPDKHVSRDFSSLGYFTYKLLPPGKRKKVPPMSSRTLAMAGCKPLGLLWKVVG